jgi:hypothetical protein
VAVLLDSLELVAQVVLEQPVVQVVLLRAAGAVVEQPVEDSLQPLVAGVVEPAL